MKSILWAVAMLSVVGIVAWERKVARERVGPLDDGGFRLASGWKIHAAGRQIALETLPLAARVVSGGKQVLVLQAGYRKPTLSLHDLPSGAERARVPMDDAFLGLAVRENRILVGGGVTDRVHEFRLASGKLEVVRSWPRSGTGNGFLGDVAFSPDGKLLFAANLTGNSVEVFDAAKGSWIRSFPTGRIPYRLLFRGADLLVSGWTDGEILRHDPESGLIRQRLNVGPHTTDLLPVGDRLFATAANTNSVFVLANEGQALKIVERLNVSLTPRQPMGMTPSALAASEDGRRLFVICSDANALAVADISNPKQSRMLGFVPTGWYPTEVKTLAGGGLLVLNGKGLRSWPNPDGPQDNKREAKDREGHVGRIQIGGMSIIPPVDEPQLVEYTNTVLRNTPYRDERLDRAAVPKGNPIPARAGDSSPIKHVIYIVKENRTYDQVFGDLKQGNGDPSLLLFGADCSPNHRKLASEFVLFDNFYVNGDVSADGHNWSAGAIAPDFTQKLWPNVYGGRKAPFSLYWGRPPADSTQDAAVPAGGFLWTRAFDAGVTVRNYGWFTRLLKRPTDEGEHADSAQSAQLWKVTNAKFRGFDTSYPDVERMKVFLADLAECERKGEFPQLTLMRLGNDHTAGLKAGSFTPRAMFADNDVALGQLVEAVSKSRFWKSTAIFVLEDDAQAGPDHVDSHRSIAFVASPYAKRRVVDSAMYNTASMLRTIELILGLKPMTHFDAGAPPMATAFTPKPDFRAFAAVAPTASLTEKNAASGALAERSARLDFSEADLIDDIEMNDILWQGIRGSPMPAPLRSVFMPGSGRPGDDD